MKKSVLLICFLLIFGYSLEAQNTLGKADDEARVAIGVIPPDDADEVPANALELLSARISKALSLNGMSAKNESSVLNIQPSISILQQEATATAPPMISTRLQLSLKLVDQYQGQSYNEILYEVSGVGESKEEAYVQAFRRFKARDRRLRGFIQQGRDHAIEYYNAHCDLVISKANGLISAHKYQEAYDLLMGVPSVSRECYDQAMGKIREFGDKLPGDIQPEQAIKDTTEGDDGQTVSGLKIDLLNGLVVEYQQGRHYGEELVLKFEVRNPRDEEENIELRGGRRGNYLINGEGEQIEMKRFQIANKSHRYGLKYDILPGTPVEMTYFFPKEKTVRQLVINLNNTVYKLNNLPIEKLQP